MDSASKQPGPQRRARWMMAGGALLLCAVLGGLAVLQEHAAQDAQARKNPTELAFEKNPERWLAQPVEASVFEKAVTAGQLAAVAVDGTLVLYTDRQDKPHSTWLIDCGPNCRNDLAAR